MQRQDGKIVNDIFRGVVQHRIIGGWLGEECGVGGDESGKEHWNSIVKGVLCHVEECGLYVTDRRELWENEVVESS